MPIYTFDLNLTKTKDSKSLSEKCMSYAMELTKPKEKLVNDNCINF